MSYSAIPRSNYLTFQPKTPFENGSVGWSKAPYVGWGMNPNQMLPYELAGLGADAVPAPTSAPPAPPPAEALPVWPAFVLYGLGALGMLAIWRLSKD